LALPHAEWNRALRVPGSLYSPSERFENQAVHRIGHLPMQPPVFATDAQHDRTQGLDSFERGFENLELH
jgi:hypothetical protein